LDQPTAARTNTVGKFDLIQAKGFPAFADRRTEIAWRVDEHGIAAVCTIDHITVCAQSFAFVDVKNRALERMCANVHIGPRRETCANAGA
jgi:hypothetical protein